MSGTKKKMVLRALDKYPCEAVDILSDITKPLPFDDNSVDEVLMDNVIEHIVDLPALFKELGQDLPKTVLRLRSLLLILPVLTHGETPPMFITYLIFHWIILKNIMLRITRAEGLKSYHANFLLVE